MFFKFLFTSLLATITTFSFCQLSKTDIQGTWKVQKAKVDAPKDETTDKAENFFIDADFKFNADGSFNLILNKKSNPELKEIFEMMNNKKWKINEKKTTVLIGTNQDNFSIAAIVVKNIDSKTIFILGEEPTISLEMIKLNTL